MTADHFPGNPFATFSNPYFGPFGFFSAALGFVFLSGLVAGLVYQEHRTSYGDRSVILRVFRRVRDLYLTQMIVFLVLVVALALHVSGVERWHLDAISETPWTGLFFGSFLLYEPGYLGILPMYCFFLLLTPIVLLQFQRGNARYILGVSALIWMTSGLLLRLPENPEGLDFGAFNPLGYQFLFVIALAFGSGQVSLDQLTPAKRKWLLRFCVAIAAGFFLLRQQYAFGGPVTSLLDRLGNAFSIHELGPLRLLSFAVFAVVLYSVCRRVQWEHVEIPAFRWLSFVGRHSLPVFAWSILATYGAVALFPSHPDSALGLLGVVAAVASLTIPAHVHAIIRERRRPSAVRSVIAALPTRSARRAA